MRTELKHKKGGPLMKDSRKYARQPQVTAKDFAMRIAKFETLDKIDLKARALDMSAEGMSVESDIPLEPGFVWFRDCVGDHKGGVVVWTRVFEDNTCRAGIKFIPLDPGRNDPAPERGVQPYPSSCHAPELVASMLVDEVSTIEG
jgi:hypothetical protein